MNHGSPTQTSYFVPAHSQRRSSDATRDLAHDLVLPSLLFMALGAMTWAVRGCSGFGAVNGCIFAGVTWGAGWWYIARDSDRRQSRRYSSGWIILALTIGIGISGNRGWMQWPSFFEGHLQLNTAEGKFLPISKTYGFIWLFIAGVPWAGLGACMLAWCAPQRPLTARDWVLRLSCGLGMALLTRTLFYSFPEAFLPLYHRLQEEYADLSANPNLRRLIGDNRAALVHLGWYIGFLGYEAIRRDWKNVVLISTVGVINGVGWAVCQNWHWAAQLWPQANFNWWRCWESCGGISIGVAYGLAYYLVNRRMRPDPKPQSGPGVPNPYPNLERLGAYFGLLLGLGLSVKNGLKGWANIYLGNEEHWNRVLSAILGPALLCGAVALVVRIRLRPVAPGYAGDLFPHDRRLIWLVLITQNIIAQLVTGPYTVWNEMAFKIYYLLLLALSSTIIYHFSQGRRAILERSVGNYGLGREE
jgi:hypothetical protein